MTTLSITDKWLGSGRCKPLKGRHRADFWDSSIPNFGVRVSETGRVTFVVRYRAAGGVKRRMKLGTYPSTKLKTARSRAKSVLNRVDGGEDPAAEKAEKRKRPRPMTLGEFLDHYLERHSKPRKKSWKEDARRIERIKGKLGKRPLVALTTPDVAGLHAEIGKTAPIEANRTVQLLTTALNKAVRWGHLPKGSENVAAEVERYDEQTRERFLTRDELPRVLEALGKERSAYVRGAFLLILLTGLRKGEALGLRWEHVDLDNRLLRIPETKAGGSRSVPLTDAAVQLLEDLPRETGPWVFPGRYSGTHVSVSQLNRAWRRIRKSAKVEDVTIHDLRRSVGSWLAMQGVGLPIIGAVLGHADHRATAIYARLQPDAGREALNRYSAMLTDLMDDEDKIAGRIG